MTRIEIEQIAPRIAAARERRAPLAERLAREGTNTWRVFHGAAEGWPGTSVDRYGDVLLVQTWRHPLEEPELAALIAALEPERTLAPHWAWNHRGSKDHPGALSDPELATKELEVLEGGLRYRFRARHRGNDPWLYLDMRSGRRRVRELAAGKSVLNLFSYTGSLGVAAAAAGAKELWQVDFSASALGLCGSNHELNPSETDVVLLESDCLAALRQLAGQRVQRARMRRGFPVVERRLFDLVLLDPPRYAKGPVGTVDVVNDYPSLAKPALLALEDGGALLATNHVAEVSREEFARMLTRTAEKAGRPWSSVEIFGPEDDFPSFDGQPPLKIALCRLP
ncbi:MAG: class I SAM-dependent methyltransferase [Planctomycetes bacterium]|nr:class I SAM-dependent methyltransferase [Planctomycetota bacterium]